ncbi:MAG TPA: hypothetical protein VME70_16280 [Mycobacteriales bacterium]|nr:hypothetical protein [Mycobacteriales bacterium]
MAAELRRLRNRVRELESELERLEAANKALSGGDLVIDNDMLTLSVPEPEPALT